MQPPTTKNDAPPRNGKYVSSLYRRSATAKVRDEAICQSTSNGSVSLSPSRRSALSSCIDEDSDEDELDATSAGGRIDFKEIDEELEKSLKRILLAPAEEFHGLGKLCVDLDPFGENDERWDEVSAYLERTTLPELRPDAICQKQGLTSETSLHLILRREPPLSLVEQFVHLAPRCLEMTNILGRLPLHIACEHNAPSSVISFLVKSSPSCIEEFDLEKKTPLHLLLECAKLKLIVTCIDELASHQNTQTEDESGHTPFHILGLRCNRLNPRNKTKKTQYEQCLRSLLNQEPDGSSKFFATLQTLPTWLRDRAVVNYHVKCLLNRDTSRRFPTFMLLLDFYVQCMVLWSFNTAATQYIIILDEVQDKKSKYARVPDWSIVCVYVGVGYYCVRELTQIFSTIPLKVFGLWVRDLWNWLDIIYLAALISATTFITVGSPFNDTGDLETFYRLGLALAGGLVWFKFISLLKSTNKSFAVFTTGVLHVIWSLRPFLLMMFIIIGAFSEMYYMVYLKTPICPLEGHLTHSPTSDGAIISISPCTLEGSFLVVYKMFVAGELDEEHLIYSEATQILSFFFSLLAMILLLNVLIALVTESYIDVRKRGERVFWAQRLGFVSEMDMLDDLFLCLCGSGRERLSKKENHDPMNGPLNILWESMILAFEPTTIRKDLKAREQHIEEHWKGPKWVISRGGPVEMFFRRAAYILIIPLWLILGLGTAGLLWPHTVRLWILCPHLSEEEGDDHQLATVHTVKEVQLTYTSTIEEVSKKIDANGEDMANLKQMMSNVLTALRENNKQIATLVETSPPQCPSPNSRRESTIEVNTKVVSFLNA